MVFDDTLYHTTIAANLEFLFVNENLEQVKFCPVPLFKIIIARRIYLLKFPSRLHLPQHLFL